MQKPYSQACDFFSLGVVLFIMLSGLQPFVDSDDKFEIYDKIKRCDYNFNAPMWSNVSEEAKDFISKLLVVDPEARLTG